MAIMAPAEMPIVLKLNPDPIKKYCLTKLGHPVVEVEIVEDQWETLLRVSGDWIAGYFPKEQKLAVFYTQPLQPTYPMPDDAYWIQEVSWDPVTTRIDDVFGAESFLFCVSPLLKVLAKDDSLQLLGNWEPHWKVKTPYGDSKLKIKDHQNRRMLPKIKITYDNGIVEATANHTIAISGGKWREFDEITVGQALCGVDNNMGIHNIDVFESSDALGVRAIGAGCYYGCIDGMPVLMH